VIPRALFLAPRFRFGGSSEYAPSTLRVAVIADDVRVRLDGRKLYLDWDNAKRGFGGLGALWTLHKCYRHRNAIIASS